MLAATVVARAAERVLASVDAPPLVIDGVSYRVILKPVEFADCQDAGAQMTGHEIARTHVGYRFAAVVDPSDRKQRLLAASVDAAQTYVELPQISWPNMTPADSAAVAKLIDEITVHERGHILVGLASAAEVTQLHHIIVPNDLPAENAIARTIEERQQAYDAETSHGIHQSRATGDLHGDDVKLVCRVER